MDIVKRFINTIFIVCIFPILLTSQKEVKPSITFNLQTDFPLEPIFYATSKASLYNIIGSGIGGNFSYSRTYKKSEISIKMGYRFNPLNSSEYIRFYKPGMHSSITKFEYWRDNNIPNLQIGVNIGSQISRKPRVSYQSDWEVVIEGEHLIIAPFIGTGMKYEYLLNESSSLVLSSFIDLVWWYASEKHVFDINIEIGYRYYL